MDESLIQRPHAPLGGVRCLWPAECLCRRLVVISATGALWRFCETPGARLRPSSGVGEVARSKTRVPRRAPVEGWRSISAVRSIGLAEAVRLCAPRSRRRLTKSIRESGKPSLAPRRRIRACSTVSRLRSLRSPLRDLDTVSARPYLAVTARTRTVAHGLSDAPSLDPQWTHERKRGNRRSRNSL